MSSYGMRDTRYGMRHMRRAWKVRQSGHPLGRIVNRQFILIFLLCFTTAAWADIPPMTPSHPTPSLIDQPVTTSDVTPPRYRGARVADIAPAIELPTITGKTWKSAEEFAKRAINLIVVGEKAAPEATGNLIGTPLFEAATQLDRAGVATVLAFSGARTIDMKLPTDSKMTTIFDAKSELQNTLGIGPETIAVVAIDKAGFIRRLEQIDDPATVAPLIQLIGDPTPRLEVGKPAPDFSIGDMYGHVRRLADWRGQKNVLLTFFPKCFTGGCTNHLSSLRDQQAGFLATNTQILAVSVDPAEGERGQIAFAKRWNFNFPLLPDTGHNVTQLYNDLREDGKAERMSIIIDKDGIVRAIDHNVNVHTHGTDVLLRLNKLGLDK